MEEEEETGGGEGWLLSYADLMTLLFATFVVLYGLKKDGETKEILGVLSSIREAFIEVPEELPEEHREGPIKKGDWVFEYYKADRATPNVVKKKKKFEFVDNVVNEDLQKVKSLITTMTTAKKIKKEGEGRQEEVGVHRNKDGFSVRFMASVLYDTNSYQLKPAALKRLKEMAILLKELNQFVLVEGHTDSSRVRGQFSNWELSALRASYAARYIMDEGGIDPDLVGAAGYADRRPRFDNATKDGRELNRRIELRVVYKREYE